MSEPTIAIGVDESPASLNALRFAVDEAKRRGGRVLAITAWTWLGEYAQYTPITDRRGQADLAKVAQDRTIRHALANVTDVPPIDRHVVEGTPEEMLVHTASDAALLVVGTNHKGPLKRILSASVSDYCVRHSRVPVAVVPFVDSAALDLDHETAAGQHGQQT